MTRAKRKTIGGYYYHVINRANGKLRIFRKAGDFLAFEKILGEMVGVSNMMAKLILDLKLIILE